MNGKDDVTYDSKHVENAIALRLEKLIVCLGLPLGLPIPGMERLASEIRAAIRRDAFAEAVEIVLAHPATALHDKLTNVVLEEVAQQLEARAKGETKEKR
jgi:hypothetical protein